MSAVFGRGDARGGQSTKLNLVQRRNTRCLVTSLPPKVVPIKGTPILEAWPEPGDGYQNEFCLMGARALLNEFGSAPPGKLKTKQVHLFMLPADLSPEAAGARVTELMRG